jgi:mercuric ion transport protein
MNIDDERRTPKIDLIYFEGCPNAAQARRNLRDAIAATGRELSWSEWNLMAETTPVELRRFGSPTVLVDGEDVTGERGDAEAMACRADGVPTVEVIAGRLD